MPSSSGALSADSTSASPSRSRAPVIGFARTFFFRPWYPQYAHAHGAPESIFYVHGVAFTAWLLLLLAQTSLVTAGRVDVHRRLGWVGAALVPSWSSSERWDR